MMPGSPPAPSTREMDRQASTRPGLSDELAVEVGNLLAQRFAQREQHPNQLGELGRGSTAAVEQLPKAGRLPSLHGDQCFP
jgi:hypothetical protein